MCQLNPKQKPCTCRKSTLVSTQGVPGDITGKADQTSICIMPSFSRNENISYVPVSGIKAARIGLTTIILFSDFHHRNS